MNMLFGNVSTRVF